MLLTKFEPFGEFRELRRGFNYLNSIMEGLEEQGIENGVSFFVPTVNSRETEDAYFVEVDLPGIKKDDISIDIKDNILTISGERKAHDEVKEENYYKIESKFGKFSKSFTLPKDVDTDKIGAKNLNGVLEIKIPKQKVVVEKPKKIQIK